MMLKGNVVVGVGEMVSRTENVGEIIIGGNESNAVQDGNRSEGEHGTIQNSANGEEEHGSTGDAGE